MKLVLKNYTRNWLGIKVKVCLIVETEIDIYDLISFISFIDLFCSCIFIHFQLHFTLTVHIGFIVNTALWHNFKFNRWSPKRRHDSAVSNSTKDLFYFSTQTVTI